MLARAEREQEAMTRNVQRLDYAISECERRRMSWTSAHAAGVATRQAYATAKARVERLLYAITNMGRAPGTIPQDELDAFVVAVGDLHAAGRALLPMLTTGPDEPDLDDKQSVRNQLDQSARDRLQMRSAPRSLLDRVRSVPAPAAAVQG